VGNISSITLVHELGLPEHAYYRDTGCSWHPTCLTCPFERCRYDLEEEEFKALARSLRSPAANAAARAEAHKQMARELRAKGLKVYEIAAQLHVTTRTVHRMCR